MNKLGVPPKHEACFLFQRLDLPRLAEHSLYKEEGYVKHTRTPELCWVLADIKEVSDYTLDEVIVPTR